MVNTCKEFQLLPLSKGDPSIRDFAPPSGEEPSLTGGRIFSLEILYPDQQKISSEPLTEGRNDHFHLFFIREEPSLTEGPNVVHYNWHTSNQCNGSSPSLMEEPSGFHYNFDIKSMRNIITIPNAGAK